MRKLAHLLCVVLPLSFFACGGDDSSSSAPPGDAAADGATGGSGGSSGSSGSGGISDGGGGSPSDGSSSGGTAGAGGSACAVKPPSGWNLTDVPDEYGTRPAMIRAAQGSNADIHVLYVRQRFVSPPGPDLRHAVLTSAGWTVNAVAGLTLASSGQKLARLVPGAGAALATAYASGHAVRYATYSGSTWSTELIDSNQAWFAGQWFDFAQPSSGPVAAIVQALYDKSSGSWATTTLGLASGAVPLAMTEAGDDLHLIYQAGGSSTPLYNVRTGAAWGTAETITTSTSYSWGSGNFVVQDFTVDADGFVHLCAADFAKVFYLTNRSGSWQDQLVVQRPSHGFSCAILATTPEPKLVLEAVATIDSADCRTILLANRQAGSWSTEDVLTDSDGGILRNSFAGLIDPGGTTHLFYGQPAGVQGQPAILKHATR